MVTEDSIRGIRDLVPLLIAYDTLCRRGKLVSLKVKDVKINLKNGSETSNLLRKSKTDQDHMGKNAAFKPKTPSSTTRLGKKLPKDQEFLVIGIDRGGRISDRGLSSGQINRIYKRIAKNASIEDGLIEQINGHSMRVGAAQDLLNSGGGMPIITQRTR